MNLFTVILFSLLFSAFFSGMEIAFISSNRLHIELQNKKGLFPYRILSFLTKHPGRFIATLLIGNNIALVIYGQYMHKVLVPFLNLEFSAYILLLIENPDFHHYYSLSGGISAQSRFQGSG